MAKKKLRVELKRFHPDARIPQYKTDGAAAFDLEARGLPAGLLHIPAGATVPVPTGIGIFLDSPDYALFIHERSGVGAKGIGRRAGLVDSDYQGEIKVLLTNHTADTFVIMDGDRIGQAVVQQVERLQFEVVDDFSTPTGRGTNGFGSTGR